ncbi:MAG: sporulation protein [Chloroflexota bacterium]
MTAVRATNESNGVAWTLELERRDLLPGRLVNGTVRLELHDDVESRGLVIALVATEQWQHTETHTDGQGHTSTRTKTERRELVREPVQVLGPARFRKGETRDVPFQLPVPGLGPATLDATVSRLTWELDAKLDLAGGFDSGLVMDVHVLQPTALLRAGVVPVEQFALYPAADSETNGARASVELDPMPLCVGAPFTGRLTIETDRTMQLQEIRAELRVKVRATVGSGLDEEITLWVGRLSGPGDLAAGSRTFEFRGDLPPRYLPTIELPHGRTDAQFHVILARSMARDPHLIRDVAICSTTEI